MDFDEQDVQELYDTLDEDKNPMYGNGFVPTLIQKTWFDNMILGTIVLYALWIWVDTDVNKEPKKGEERLVPELVFQIVAMIFCFIFTVEIVLRFFAYEKWYNFFISWRGGLLWNWFDALLVGSMIYSDVILVILQTKGSVNLAIFRLLRLARITRIIRQNDELLMMVKSLVKALRTVLITFALLLILMYVIAILMTNWVNQSLRPLREGDDRVCFTDAGDDTFCFHPHFGMIHKSMLTLIQLVIFDGSFDIILPVLNLEDNDWAPFYGLILLTYTVLGSLLLLNMLIGVICEIVGSTTQEEKNKMMMERLIRAFQTLDVDRIGVYPKEHYNKADTEAALKTAGLEKDLIKKIIGVLRFGERDVHLHSFIQTVQKLQAPPGTYDLLTIVQGNEEIKKSLGIHTTNPNDNKSFGKKSETTSLKVSSPGSQDMKKQAPGRFAMKKNNSGSPTNASTTFDPSKDNIVIAMQQLLQLAQDQNTKIKRIEEQTDLMSGVPEQISHINWRLDHLVTST